MHNRSMIFTPRHMPCAECGSSVDAHDETMHLCARDHLVAFTVFSLRGSTATFGTDLAGWLTTPPGAFETWLAARTVRTAR